jgi:hypothetical protein
VGFAALEALLAAPVVVGDCVAGAASSLRSALPYQYTIK